ncbi:L-rhamnose mutarotase [Duganella sp. PWIR1]
MKVREGKVAEYKRRQQHVWPHLERVLRHVGIYDYSIFLDEETRHLFAVLKLWPDHQMESLQSHPTMARWWLYMADVMEVGPDNLPRQWPLESTFHFA